MWVPYVFNFSYDTAFNDYTFPAKTFNKISINISKTVNTLCEKVWIIFFPIILYKLLSPPVFIWQKELL